MALEIGGVPPLPALQARTLGGEKKSSMMLIRKSFGATTTPLIRRQIWKQFARSQSRDFGLAADGRGNGFQAGVQRVEELERHLPNVLLVPELQDLTRIARCCAWIEKMAERPLEHVPCNPSKILKNFPTQQ